jgi:glycosyltransferase involved in cell wall biosynthesis
MPGHTQNGSGGERPEYSFIVPTYKRPDVLALCLEHIAALDYPLNRIEVLVFDNGGEDHSGHVVERFRDRLPLRFVVNEGAHGMGYSLNRGLRACQGAKIVEMNDDALVPADLLKACDAVFASDPKIGCIGMRALEECYYAAGDGIGRIDDSGEVIGNFDRQHDGLLEVEHVYGFCYAYTREALCRGGVHDEVLLARDYSSGNRMETDHCLTLRRHGFKVVYDSRIVVRHLAKPRGDYNERSLRWKLNHTRNTLYLYLKHYGLFGKRCLALRFTFLQDVGIISAVRRPTRANLAYFLTGCRGRLSSYWHYSRYILGL